MTHDSVMHLVGLYALEGFAPVPIFKMLRNDLPNAAINCPCAAAHTECFRCGRVMPKDREPDFFGTAGGELKLPPVRPLGRVKQRLIRSAVEIEADDPESLLFQHTVFCQTGLPYHDPGAAVREWERAQGSVALKVQAGEAHNPETGAW